MSLGSHIVNAYHAVAINERRGPFKPTLWDSTEPSHKQTVVQAWFPGVHSNVGGGYVDSGLSDRALLWMIYNANKHGLRFDDGYINLIVRPNWFGEMRDSVGLKYKLMFWNRPRDRSIGTVSATTEFLHMSVFGRWQHPTRPDEPPANVNRAKDKVSTAETNEWEANFNLASRVRLDR